MFGRRARLATSMVVAAILALGTIPAFAQDASPDPAAEPEATAEPLPTPTVRPGIRNPRGGNLALTIVEADVDFFTDSFGIVKDRLPDTYLRRAIVGDGGGDGHVGMILLRNGDVGRPLQARLDLIDSFGGVRGSQTYLGSVARQRSGLNTSRFDHIGYIVAAETDFKEDEPPRIENAIQRLRRTPGVALLARGVGEADVIVLYRVGPKLGQGSTTAQTIDRILRTSRLEPIAEGILLPAFD